MRTMRAAIGAVAAAVLFLACGAFTGSTGADAHLARNLVIDTDMGLDDVRALFALLPAAESRTEAIVVTEGSASRAKGVENLGALLHAIDDERIPVFAGAASGAGAPEWRETANTLGGVPIVDHHDETPAAGDLAGLRGRLAAAGSGIGYLALGPLTTAAAIASDPRALAAIDTIWIPVRVERETVSGWNLSRDARSAELVMKKARCVVLLDISRAAEIDARDLFSSLDDGSPAGRWIKRSLAASGGHGVHEFLHDELAAAALAEPPIAGIEDTAYRVRFAHGAFSLAPSPDGNVRLATFKSPGDAAAVLAILWHAPAHFEHYVSTIPVVDLIKTFHGHLGPYVVIGYRMGRLGLEATGCEGHFDVSAVVYSYLEPPRSCLIDGVQLGSGCTLGKRNIEVRATDGPAYAVFDAENGARVTVKLRPEAAALVGRLIEEKGVEAAGMDILETPLEELFEVTPAPPPAKKPPAPR
jgi:formylmethanofuran dehydrogenase subunit E